MDPAREAAGLPLGRSARGTLTLGTSEIEAAKRLAERDKR